MLSFLSLRSRARQNHDQTTDERRCTVSVTRERVTALTVIVAVCRLSSTTAVLAHSRLGTLARTPGLLAAYLPGTGATCRLPRCCLLYVGCRFCAGPHSHRSTAPHRGYLYIPHSALYSYSLLRIAANGLAAPCASRPCWLVLYPLRIMRCMQDTVGMHRRLTTS